MQKLTRSIKGMFVLIILLSALTAYSQNFPTGGYQGGNFGNVKVKTWSGSVDNKWNESGNWCPAGVPGPTDDIIIPSSASVMPEVDVSGMSCRDLLIRAGATLKVNPGYTLTVNRHFTIEKE
jgi:hypothetical protein